MPTKPLKPLQSKIKSIFQKVRTRIKDLGTPQTAAQSRQNRYERMPIKVWLITIFKIRLFPKQVRKLRHIKKGNKPLPRSYLSEKYIAEHLDNFEKYGCYKFVNGNYWTPSQLSCGYSIFVIDGKIVSEILQKANKDVKIIEKELGLPNGYLGSKPLLLHFANPSQLRIPDGNERGAFQYAWIPGGYTIGGTPEAIITIQNGEQYEIAEIC